MSKERLGQQLIDYGYCSDCYQSTGFNGSECSCWTTWIMFLDDTLRKFIPDVLIRMIIEYVQPVVIHITKRLNDHDCGKGWLHEKKCANTWRIYEHTSCLHRYAYDEFESQANVTIESVSYEERGERAVIIVKDDFEEYKAWVVELKDGKILPKFEFHVESDYQLCMAHQEDNNGKWVLVAVDKTNKRVKLGTQETTGDEFKWRSMSFFDLGVRQVLQDDHDFVWRISFHPDLNKILLVTDHTFVCANQWDHEKEDCFYAKGCNMQTLFEIPFEAFSAPDIQLRTTDKHEDHSQESELKQVIKFLVHEMTNEETETKQTKPSILECKEFIEFGGHCSSCWKRHAHCQFKEKDESSSDSDEEDVDEIQYDGLRLKITRNSHIFRYEDYEESTTFLFDSGMWSECSESDIFKWNSRTWLFARNHKQWLMDSVENGMFKTEYHGHVIILLFDHPEHTIKVALRRVS